MKKRTRWTALLLTVCMVFVMTAVSASAYTPQYEKCAQALYELGLFKGMGTKADGSPNFALDQEVTREQALVMLIRLMGEEEEALSYTGRHPFADVAPDHWANPYVAYGYFRGYTNGMSGKQFGLGQPANANMYLTFVLRALGFDDSKGDFAYAGAYLKAANIGLITSGSYAGGGPFYRDDCAYISYKALLQTMSNYVQTLGEYLNAKGVIPTTDLKPVEQLPELPGKPTAPTTPATPSGAANDGSRREVTVNSAAELAAAMQSNTQIYLADGTYTLDWESYSYAGLENVAIVGTGDTKLVINSYDDEVLCFSDCKGLILSGLILGHDVPSEGACSAGVLQFYSCTDTQVIDCDIFGCGFTGLTTFNSTVDVRNTTIRDCSYNIADLSSSTVSFRGCTFRGNDYEKYESDAFGLTSTTVTLDGCTFTDNRNPKLYSTWEGSNSTWTETNCTHTGNGWQ